MPAEEDLHTKVRWRRHPVERSGAAAHGAGAAETRLGVLLHEPVELPLLGAAFDRGALLQQHPQAADPVLRGQDTGTSAP